MRITPLFVLSRALLSRALHLDFNEDSKADKKPKKKLKGFFDERDSDDDDGDASDIDKEIIWKPGLKGKVHDKSNDSKPSKAKKLEKKSIKRAVFTVLMEATFFLKPYCSPSEERPSIRVEFILG